MRHWTWTIMASALVADAAPANSWSGSMTVVDVDYTRLQGNYNSNDYGSEFYSFSNVQYASAKRFGLPEAPPTNRSIQTGAQQFQCAQTQPTWNNAESDYAKGQAPVWANKTIANATAPPAGAQDECLFLDMLVPEAVLNRKATKAPVLVYIHGGGYTAGDKAGDNPDGSASLSTHEGQGYMTRSNGSVIFVSVSYRLGIFGWLAGESYTKHAKTNLGLRDQRAALEWIQKYISKFGGDPENVTIMGESAGGGSCMHQLIAYGGKDIPFKRAIPQSPWHQPLTRQHQELLYQYTLQVANVTTFEELQALPYDTIFRVNDVVISNQYPFGLFNVGPVVDNDILPAYYNDLINEGSFERSAQVMVGHVADEGFIFASTFIHDEMAYVQWLQDILSDASNRTVQFVATKLYPPIFDGSQGYTDWHGRVAKTIGDMSAKCNAEMLNKAFNKYNGPTSSYAFEWTLAPGRHGEDIAYIMYAEGASRNINATLAMRNQDFIVNFVKTGNPNGPGLPEFPNYDSYGSRLVENMNSSGATEIPSDEHTPQCQFWMAGEYRY